MGKNENIKDNNQNHENNESEVDGKKEWETERIKATTRVITYKVK